MSTVRFDIVCDDHPESVIVRTFPVLSKPGWVVPLLMPDKSRSIVRDADDRVLDDDPAAELLAMEQAGEPYHWGYVLRCPSCGDSPVSVRSDRLRALMVGLLGLGVSHVSLRGLR